jgi:hypothetical protein
MQNYPKNPKLIYIIKRKGKGDLADWAPFGPIKVVDQASSHRPCTTARVGEDSACPLILDSTCTSKTILPRIIGLWILPSISIIITSRGTKVICNSTSTSLTLPRACLVEESTSN